MHQRSFISLLTILLLSTFSYSAFAQSVEQLQASANEINAKIQALDKEIATYNTQLANTQGEAKTLKAALSSLELRRASLLKETERTNLRIREAGQNIEGFHGALPRSLSRCFEYLGQMQQRRAGVA